MMDDLDARIEKIFAEKGIDKDNVEAAIEIGKKLAQEEGICCEELGKTIWWFYQELSKSEKELV